MRKLLLAVLGLGAALAQEINPQGIIVNPVPTDLEVQVWVDKDPAKRGNAVYRIGESIYIYVRVNQDAYVYLFNINADGRIDPILPNPYERDNFLRAGETRRFPPEGARYRYTITGPEGEDRILAVASRRPLSVAEILDVERGEVRVQGWEGLARALSIVIKPVPAKDWVTDVARYYVGRGEAPPPAEATLEVDSSPRGAEVYVDGGREGRTPLSLAVRPGRHEVELRLPGYAPYRATVNARPGERVRVFARLVPSPRRRGSCPSPPALRARRSTWTGRSGGGPPSPSASPRGGTRWSLGFPGTPPTGWRSGSGKGSAPRSSPASSPCSGRGPWSSRPGPRGRRSTWTAAWWGGRP